VNVTEFVVLAVCAVLFVAGVVVSATSQAHPFGAAVVNPITPELATPPVPTFTLKNTEDVPADTLAPVPNPLEIVRAERREEGGTVPLFNCAATGNARKSAASAANRCFMGNSVGLCRD
jgi:hypothetical protein